MRASSRGAAAPAPHARPAPRAFASPFRAPPSPPPLPRTPGRRLRRAQGALGGRTGSPPAASAPGTADGPDLTLPDDAGVPGFDPMEELGVPRDQRPVNELKALRASPLYDWACLPPSGLASRCASALAGVTLLLSAPIAAATFDPATELPQLALAASAGSLLVLLLLLVRTYLGWDHVGGRLLAAVVEYEETGWYDGQRFVKPPRVLARDRLLGAYEALPALARLRTALGATALALGLACASLGAVQSQAPAAVAERAAAEAQQQRAAGGGGAQPGGGGAGAGRGGGGGAAEAEEEEENTEGFELGGGPWGPSARLLYSDRAAEAERGAIEARLGPGVPAYCADRYARALAGDGVDCDALLAQGRAVRGAAAAAAAAAGGGGG